MQDYRDKVGYKKVAVCWCEELKDVIELQVNRKIEFGLAQAIANTPGAANPSGAPGSQLTTGFNGPPPADMSGGGFNPWNPTNGDWGGPINSPLQAAMGNMVPADDGSTLACTSVAAFAT